MGFESEVNGKIDDVVFDYQIAMLEAGEIAWNNVEPMIIELNTDGSQWERLVPGQHIDIGTPLTKAVQSSKVQRAKERMKNQLDNIRLIIRDYYTAKFGEPVYEVRRQATGLVSNTKNILDDNLSEFNFILDLVYPVESIMMKHIAESSTIFAASDDMRHRIQDGLQNFSLSKAGTIMQVFARDLGELYGNQPGRKALYAGPQDSVNREFCAERVGKKFTQAEIKDWATLDWDGKIANTNRSNIEKLLGGYLCRHILVYEM